MWTIFIVQEKRIRAGWYLIVGKIFSEITWADVEDPVKGGVSGDFHLSSACP